MRYYCLLVFAILITGCNRNKFVDFNGKMPGINNGMFVIKDLNGTPVFSEDIFDGKFHIRKLLPAIGYYDLFITEDVTNDYKKHVYDIYLEPGNYTIAAQAGKLDAYPTITSTSPIQNQLSDYNKLITEQTTKAQEKVDSISAKLYGANGPILHTPAFDKLYNELTAASNLQANAVAGALAAFVEKHPGNQVEAHILSGIDYKKDPESYAAIYQKFSPEQKNTEEGKSEGDDLNMLAKLSAGSMAPKLNGKTPAGVAFDPKTINKKVILVEFWRSDNQVSRMNHKSLLADYNSPLKNKDVAVISVSLDTQTALWADAVKEDKLTWTQLNDLKGENSPNMTSWLVSTIPTYDLVDGSWHIIKRDVDFNQLSILVNDYLTKKP